MSKLQARVTRIHVTPDDIDNERAFSIEIDDEGAGEFLVIRSACSQQTLDIDIDEWPALRDAVDLMMKNVRTDDDWTAGEERMDAIGRNGNGGEHYPGSSVPPAQQVREKA